MAEPTPSSAPLKTADLPLAARTAPERIWLDLGVEEAEQVNFAELGEVTWSPNNATGHGIEYVRADAQAVAAQAPAAVAVPDSLAAKLKEALQKIVDACAEIPEALEGYLEPLSNAVSDARDVLEITPPPVEFEDPRVQAVYSILCGDETPPKNEHWEGFIARRIVDTISAPTAPQAQPSFQQRVQPWLMECFGEVIAGDREERNHRFLEEALELVQSCGCTASEAHQLVDYVFGRPIGEPVQEAGGVMVTLAALCLANGLDMHQAGETELARIWTKVDAIRAKQAAKPKHSPLPQAQPADAPIAYLQEADQHLLRRFIKTVEDDDSFDIGKEAVKRLANLGVVENCGFGRYKVTMFGYWVHEHFWHQNPSLPLKTYADRDLERRAAMAAAQEGGNAATGKDGAA
ncbi:hypothetical protein HNP33_004232 [Comamonas odontotermitis]|uniref:Uncharacterized protein n=1 Tax=Comamonas odontotermitis TaxID=379895 RepID=A0ABR6RLP7_9BURK|nr:hypothetical protein [Comamonas odontotermitis]MBB6580101.1 hypothetical protein [Comamonas odontotermitis]